MHCIRTVGSFIDEVAEDDFSETAQRKKKKKRIC